MEQINVVSFNESRKLAQNVLLNVYPAGHVIGAAMFCVDLNNYKLFYTGDYSMEKDHSLSKAQVPENL